MESVLQRWSYESMKRKFFPEVVVDCVFYVALRTIENGLAVLEACAAIRRVQGFAT